MISTFVLHLTCRQRAGSNLKRAERQEDNCFLAARFRRPCPSALFFRKLSFSEHKHSILSSVQISGISFAITFALPKTYFFVGQFVNSLFFVVFCFVLLNHVLPPYSIFLSKSPSSESYIRNGYFSGPNTSIQNSSLDTKLNASLLFTSFLNQQTNRPTVIILLKRPFASQSQLEDPSLNIHLLKADLLKVKKRTSLLLVLYHI